MASRGLKCFALLGAIAGIVLGQSMEAWSNTDSDYMSHGAAESRAERKQTRPVAHETIAGSGQSSSSLYFVRAARDGVARNTMVAQARRTKKEKEKNGTRPRSAVPEGENPSAASRQRSLGALVDTEEVYFTVVNFQVEGNTLLEEEQIRDVLRPFRGFAQQVTDMEQARLTLERTYHTSGYPTVLVLLPQQKIEGGTIRIEVVESKIHEVKVTGTHFFSTDQILDKMPSVRPGSIIYEPALIKELGAVNAHPDRNVTPVLKPGEEPGTVNLELKVNERLPLHASVSSDNRGSLNTPRNRIIAEVQYANLWNLEHIFTFRTVQTPQDLGAAQVYGATYVAPLGDPRRLFSLFGSLSDTRSSLNGTALPIGGGGTVGIAGNSKVAGFRYSFPWDTGTDLKHLFTVGLDYTRLEESTAKFPQGLGTAVVSNPVEYLPLSLGYTGTLGHHSGVSTFTVGLKGNRAGILPKGKKEDFGGDPNDPSNKPGNRVGSTGTFGIIKASLDRTQFFPADFLLTGHFDGQWANEPLIAVEELFAGGMDTVRGYNQNEALGDMGFRTRLELQGPNVTFRFDRPVNSWFKADFRLLTFFDTAFLWVRRAQPGQARRFKLRGTGIGLRAKITEYLDLQLDHGWALHDGVISMAGDSFTHFAVKLAL